jgi:multiple sugar transport system permease protein
VLILITIGTLNSLEIILALTGGGPGRSTEVMSLFILNTVFVRGNIALGSVFAVILMLICLALTFAYMRLIELDKE